jgi:transcriptional regulator with XRE-family HTH domain
MNTSKTQIISDFVKLGEIVKVKRTQLGLKQAEAAALCKVGTRFLSDLENGKTSLHMGKVFSVLNGLGLNLLVGEKGRLV